MWSKWWESCVYCTLSLKCTWYVRVERGQSEEDLNEYQMDIVQPPGFGFICESNGGKVLLITTCTQI